MTAPTQDIPTRERPLMRPPIDPRIRERRIEVTREAGRRRLRVTLVIASTIVVLGLVYLALHSPILNVDHVRISGTRREPAAAVLRAAEVSHGDALTFIDTGAVARRIEKLPWVASARVERHFPGTLAIAVNEYVPTTYIRVGPKKVALIAANGLVIAYAKKAPLHVTQLVGVPVAPVVGHRISPPAAASALRRLPPRLRSQVQSIDITSDANVVLGLRAPAAPGKSCASPAAVAAAAKVGGVSPPRSAQIRIGALTDLADKGPAALAVLDHLGAQQFAYIDVSAPQAPVVC